MRQAELPSSVIVFLFYLFSILSPFLYPHLSRLLPRYDGYESSIDSLMACGKGIDRAFIKLHCFMKEAGILQPQPQAASLLP